MVLPFALAIAVAATSSAPVEVDALHQAVVTPLDLAIDLGAEHTWAAREERTLGAAARASASLGDGMTLALASAVGRDLPLTGVADAGALKLGVSAAWGIAMGSFTPRIAGVVENGAPRVDLALEVAAHDDVALAVEIEDVLAPQVRVLLAWTFGT